MSVKELKYKKVKLTLNIGDMVWINRPVDDCVGYGKIVDVHQHIQCYTVKYHNIYSKVESEELIMYQNVKPISKYINYRHKELHEITTWMTSELNKQ